MAGYDLGTARGRIEIDASSLGRATAGLDTMGRKMVITGALGAAAFVGVVKTAADFEKILSAVAAVSGASDKEMSKLRDTALSLGATTAFSAAEVGSAMEDLAKAGISVTDITNGAAEATVNLAAAAGDELPGGVSQGAEIIANAMKTFEVSADQMDHFADVLVGAAASSTLNVEDMATTLKYAGPIANELGINFEDLAGAIAILGDRGIKGSTAGTSLRGVLLSLSPTSKKASATMKELGFITEDNTNLFFDQAGALKPLPEIMQLLQDKTKGLSQEQKVAAFNTIFQRRAMNSALILADQGAAGFDRYAKAIDKIGAKEVAEKKLDNLSGNVTKLKNAVNALIIRAGTPLLDMLSGWAKWLTDLVNKLNKMNPEILAMGLKILLAASALAIAAGSGLLFLSMMLKMYRAFVDVRAALGLLRSMLSTTFLANPVFLVIAALVALGVALYVAYQKSETFRNIVDKMIDGVQEFMSPLGFLVDRLKMVWDQLKVLVTAFRDGRMNALKFGMMIGQMARTLTNNEAITQKVAKAALLMYQVFAKAWNWIKNTAIPAAKEFLKAINWDAVLKAVGIAIFALIAPIAALVAGVIWAYRRFDWFRGALQSFGGWVKENIFPVLADFGELIVTLGGVIVAMAKATVPVWKAAFRLITTIVKVAVTTILNIWNLFGDNLINFIKIAWDFIKNIVEGALKIISGVVKVITAIIQGDWSKAWEGIKSILAGAWQAIWSTLETAWRLIILAFQTGADAIHAAWDLLWETVGKIVPATWNVILQVIKAALKAIWSVIWKAIEIIISPFKKLYDVLVGHSIIPDLMDAMKKIIGDGISAIVRFFKEFPGKVLSAIGDLTSTLLSKGRDLIYGILSGILEKWVEINSFFAGIGLRVIQAIGDLGSALYDIGKSIIQGLINGVNAMVQPLKDVLGGITDLIPISKGPPRKDARLLKPAGKLIMRGLMEGLKDSWPAVEAYLNSLNSTLGAQQFMVNATTGARMPAVSGDTFNITMEFPVTEKGQEAAMRDNINGTQLVPKLIRGIRSGVGKAKRR